MIDAPLIDKSILLDGSDDDTDTDNQQNPSTNGNVNLDRFPTIIEIVKGSLLHETSETNNSVQQQDAVQTLMSIARDTTLDRKQQMVFQIICCTFMLSWMEKLHTRDQHRQACGIISTGLGGQSSRNYEDAVALLNKHGARQNLFMFLTGAGGCGKSHVVHTSRKFCSEICRQSGLPFVKNSIYLTAASGSAAALLGGGTIHKAAGLNKKKNYRRHEERLGHC